MPNRFSIVNDALRETGNNLASEDDLVAPKGEGSDEWEVASAAFDRCLPILLERHPWNFATGTMPLDAADAEENPSVRFAAAYEWPAGALWLERVFIGGLPVDYEIVGKYVCVDYDGSEAVQARVVVSPPATAMSNLFWEVLRKQVEVSCLRSLNEDLSEASRRWQEAELMLMQARTRSDQQKPARTAFRSTMLARRRGAVFPSTRG